MARIFRESALALCTTVFLGMTSVAHAALIDKGGGLIYDTDLDLTWPTRTPPWDRRSMTAPTRAMVA